MKVTPEQMQAELRRWRVAKYGDHPDEVLDQLSREEFVRVAREMALERQKAPEKPQEPSD